MTFFIMHSCPSLRGRARQYSRGYAKLALVELEPGFTGRPKMISERAIGVRRIVSVQTVYLGKGVRSQGARYLAELKRKIQELESGTDSPRRKPTEQQQ